MAISPTAQSTSARRRSSWMVLVVALLLLVVAVLLVVSGLLVRLDNDQQGHPILPPTVGSGESARGDLVLSNGGLLPIEVFLQPSFGSAGLPPGMSATVQRLDDGAFLYQGPMARSMGPLEVLGPGQATRIRLVITSTDPHGTAAIPIDYTWYWAARPALPWWWWIPTAVAIIAFLILGYRRKPRLGSGV